MNDVNPYKVTSCVRVRYEMCNMDQKVIWIPVIDTDDDLIIKEGRIPGLIRSNREGNTMLNTMK